MHVVNTAAPRYEVIKSGLPFHGSGSLSLSNVSWVKVGVPPTGHLCAVEAWLEIPPAALTKATIRQCDQIWGAFVRAKDQAQDGGGGGTNWLNSQILPTGVKVPIVPPEYLAHKRAKHCGGKPPRSSVFKLSRSGCAVVTKLTWVVNRLSLPSEDEMTQSIYCTPAFLARATQLTRCLDTATAAMSAGAIGGSSLYSPDLAAVASLEDLMALRYNGEPVGGFAAQLWYATNERRSGVATDAADAAAQNRERHVDVKMRDV